MRTSAPALCALLLLAVAGTARGQIQTYPCCPILPVPEPAALRESLLADLERRTIAALGAIQHADDRRELEEQRAPLREKLRTSLGLDRLPLADGVEAVTTGIVERQGYRIEKLLIPTLPGLWAAGASLLARLTRRTRARRTAGPRAMAGRGQGRT